MSRLSQDGEPAACHHGPVRVLSLNVNGVRAAERKGLGALLTDLDADVVALQEVRVLAHQRPPLLSGYAAAWHEAVRPGYSGVATLARSGFVAVAAGIGDGGIDAEGRVLRTDLPGGVALVNVYAPSGSSGAHRQAAKMAFLARFLPYLEALLAEGREALVLGDVNIAHAEIDLRNWRTNQRTSGFLPEERAWFGRVLALGFVDVVRALAGPDRAVYSWWSQRAGARERDVGWRIDVQLATPGLAARARGFAVPRVPVVSDHAPVVVDYDG
jgi:exodeoxyribonuclease III